MKVLLVVFGVLTLAGGLGFLLMPGQVVTPFGVRATEELKNNAHYWGASQVALAVLAFSVVGAASSVLRPVLLCLFTYGVLVSIVSVIHQLKGAANWMGWFVVGQNVFFALSFGYLRFLRPPPEE